MTPHATIEHTVIEFTEALYVEELYFPPSDTLYTENASTGGVSVFLPKLVDGFASNE